jgi:hypothetical protein
VILHGFVGCEAIQIAEGPLDATPCTPEYLSKHGGFGLTGGTSSSTSTGGPGGAVGASRVFDTHRFGRAPSRF